MSQSLSFSNRYVRIGLVAIALLFLLMLLLAPATGQRTSGSTYNRAPEGYLGWYRYMEAQGTPVQRWRRPLDELLAQTAATPQTLIRVYSGIVSSYTAWDHDWLESWLEQGNTLIALGVDAEITEAPFTTRQDSPFGAVTIKTRRRHPIAANSPLNLLGDAYGAVVWLQSEAASGNVYIAPTPHLAANAYQTEPGNYAFLAQLATQAGGTIWVDEYLHGFKEPDVVTDADPVKSWMTYLADTPVKVAAMQAAILLGIFLLAQNRRLGNVVPVKPPKLDNSQAYIEALAAVLHKAESTTFLVDMITKAERSRLQKSLGLNESEVESATLKSAWTQQTGQSAETLTPLLQPPKATDQPSEQSLKTWLAKLRHIRQTPLR